MLPSAVADGWLVVGGLSWTGLHKELNQKQVLIASTNTLWVPNL